jgi:hypothetical protein
MPSPTSRSLNLLRRERWLTGVVESWIPKLNIRRDLFGFADIIAVHPVERVFLLVQATSRSNISARLNKAKSLRTLSDWLRAGGRFEVWGWEQSNGKWEVRRVEVLAESLDTRELTPARTRKSRRGEKTLFDEVETKA